VLVAAGSPHDATGYMTPLPFVPSARGRNTNWGVKAIAARRQRRDDAPARARYSFGPPARTSAEAWASYFLKLSRNSWATFLALSS